MLTFLAIWAIVGWLAGAAVTLKADAMQSNYPTDWRDSWWLSLLFWPGIAVAICFTKHPIYSERRYYTEDGYEDAHKLKEYRY